MTRPQSSPLRPRRGLAPLLASAAVLLLAGCDAVGGRDDVVARAAGAELTVDAAARLLAAKPAIVPDSDAVRVLADMWVDYALLASAAGRDSSLGGLDLDAFVAPAREQALVFKLRDQEVHPDTSVTVAQLEQFWREAGSDMELRTQHVLLTVPYDASPAQRDSVRRLAESVRDRARAGDDFAALARRHSQDSATARRGGDIGFRGRGQLPAASYETAAYALQPGQVSEPVESAAGFHVVKLVERRQPPMDLDSDFRKLYFQRRRVAAEDAYLRSLLESAHLQLQPGRVEAVRAIVAGPRRGDGAERVLATYDGGTVTAGEFLEFLRLQPTDRQSAFAAATDEQVDRAIDQLAWKELLLARARERQVSLSAEEEAKLRDSVRATVRAALGVPGIAELAGRQPGADSVAARVEGILRGALTGQVTLPALGPLAAFLRGQLPNEVNDAAFGAVVERASTLRGAASAGGA